MRSLQLRVTRRSTVARRHPVTHRLRNQNQPRSDRRLLVLPILQVIGRMCKIIDKTCLSPTPTLEQHLMWDDIAILARYMLMLSFNNSLDVAAHLPYLFHVVTLLVATGPLSLRASTHGLVINIIHSLCTCSQLNFSGEDAPSESARLRVRRSLTGRLLSFQRRPSRS